MKWFIDSGLFILKKATNIQHIGFDFFPETVTLSPGAAPVARLRTVIQNIMKCEREKHTSVQDENKVATNDYINKDFKDII